MPFTIPNEADAFNTNQAEPDKVDIDILVAGLLGSGVVSGCAVTAQGVPDMTVAVAAGVAKVGSTVVAVSAGNVTIGAAHPTNPRFDLITVDNTGAKAAVAGTAAAEPVFPAIPANRIVLASVFIPATDTTIEQNQITDKRVVLPNTVVFEESTEPPTPAANTLVTFAEDDGGKTRLRLKNEDGSVVTITQDSTFIVRNNTGATILKGKAVYISGSVGQRPTIALAKGDSDTTMPCVGITLEDIPNNDQGRVMFAGVLFNLNTSAFTEGDRLFVSATTAGELTATEPPHPNLKQRVAIVTNVHASQGKILVFLGSVRGDHEGTNRNLWKIGDGLAGAKSVQFINAFPSDLSWNPTAGRTIHLPDTNGTVLLGTHATTVSAVESANVVGTRTTRFALEDHQHEGIFSAGVSTVGNTAGDTGVGPGRVVVAGSNALTLSQATAAGQLRTVHIQGPASGTTAFAVASANVAGTRGSRFALEDHQHEGVFSAGVSTGGNTAGDTGVRPGRWVFEGGNNITLSQLTAAGSLQTIIISGGAGGAGDGFNIISAGTQLANTNTTVLFENSNNVTFGMSGSSRVTASIPAGATATGNIGGISAGTQLATSGTILWADSNGITFGMSASTRITASYTRNVAGAAIQPVGSATGSGTNTSRFAADDHVHEGVFSAGVSTGGNTAGNTAVRPGRWVFEGSNAITLSQATAAGSLQTIHIQGPVSATTISSVTTANVIGTRGSRFALEDHQHAGVGRIGVSTLGNTAGNTTLLHGRSVYLSGQANITLSQVTDANNDMTIGISAAAGAAAGIAAISAGTTQATSGTVIFSNSNNVSFGINGQTVTASAAGGGGGATHQFWVPPVMVGAESTFRSFGNANMLLYPVFVEQQVTASRVDNMISMSISSSSNSSHAGVISMSFGVYTISASSTLNLASSGSRTFQWTNTSNNSNSVLASLRNFSVSVNLNLTPGVYVFAIWSRTSTTNANWFTAQQYMFEAPALLAGDIGSATNSSWVYAPFKGSFSNASFTTAMPSTIHSTNIKGGVNVTQNDQPYVVLRNI